MMRRCSEVTLDGKPEMMVMLMVAVMVMVTVMVETEEAQELASRRGRWRRGKQGLSEATFDCRRGHVLVRGYY